MNQKLWTSSQAAKHLGISSETLRKWCERGYVEHIRMPSGHRKFKPEVIERMALKMRVPESGTVEVEQGDKRS
jgi:excisionase family DNA binding protein